MSKTRFPIINPIYQWLALIIGLLSLVALAWWSGAHISQALRSGPTPLPTMVPPTATVETLAPTPTIAPTITPTPRPTSTLPPTSTPTPETFSYTVRRGDTLYSLARRCGITVDEIKKLNGLTSDTIRRGDVLRLPISCR